MQPLRRTKIVATLGPSSDAPETLERLIAAGVDMVRLNFSHGRLEDHKARADQVRAIALRQGRYVSILGDLQGPKIRISTFAQGSVTLKLGQIFCLDGEMAPGLGDTQGVGLDYPALANDLHPGDLLLLDDGRIKLQVLHTEGLKIVTTVLFGGPLSNNKGVNKAGGGLCAPALTDKDKRDINMAAALEVDYLAISFVRSGADLQQARALAHAAGCRAQLVAKIERAEAVCSDEAMQEIIKASDAIMVARGDLGVEIGDPELVGVQKRLIYWAGMLNRPVITATQMMESMITQPTPTRAEVMDVANAVLDGTDAVMLSAETAAGLYPVEVVSAMANICLGAERMLQEKPPQMKISQTIEDGIALAATWIARTLSSIKVIITMTESGKTALTLSRLTSGQPIFSLSAHPETLRLCTLYRGVIPLAFEGSHASLEGAHGVMAMLKTRGFVASGEWVVITQGDDIMRVGSSNTCRILIVP